MIEQVTTSQRVKQELIRNAIQFTVFGVGAKIADDNQRIGEEGYFGEGYASDVLGTTAETSIVSLPLTGSKPWIRRFIPPLANVGRNICMEIGQAGESNKVFDWGDFPAYGLGGVIFVATDIVLEKLQERRAKKKAATIALNTQ